MESLFVLKEDVIKPEMDYEDEPMDINDDYYEEGEINSSDDEKDDSKQIQTKTFNIFERTKSKNQSDGFVTCFNVFDKDEALKKLDRAKRFSLPVKAESALELQKEQLTNLYRDLGIDKENERHYRFNAIHMRGTENMSTEDVFQYFASFVPSHIEWVNDVSCNVVWVDDVSSARALLNLSKKIINLDKVHLNADPFEKDFKETVTLDEDLIEGECVDARDIKAAIPPGFWRIGVPTEKNSSILLRFATRCDKKQRHAERSSDYYKKYGNPHYGNLPGIFSKSLRNSKKKFKSKDSSSKWDSDHEGNETKRNDKKNPWEELAHEWGKSDKVEDRDCKSINSRISHRNKSHVFKSDIPDLRISLKIKKENLKRLHINLYSEANENTSDRDNWESRKKIPCMKMYADDEEKRLDKNTEMSLKKRLLKQPVEDLRSKINRKKIRPRFKFKVENKKQMDSSASDSNNSENEYDDGDSGDWALEHYHDLRGSLEQNKRQDHNNFSVSGYQSESEEKRDNEDDDDNEYDEYDYDRNIRQRSPLQIEIDNDEYYQTK